MHISDQQFRIDAENKDEALQAIKSLMYDTSADTLGTESGHNLFSWMHGVEPEQWEILSDALSAWRFEPDTDIDGNILRLNFTGQKIGSEAQLFEVIAPYVEDGSYIEFKGEDGAVWRLLFYDGKMWRATTEETSRGHR